MKYRKKPVVIEADALREPLAWFASIMERELQKNDHKPGWSGDSAFALLARLSEERAELHFEVERNESIEAVIKEAADVANFAMMIADNARTALAARAQEADRG